MNFIARAITLGGKQRPGSWLRITDQFLGRRTKKDPINISQDRAQLQHFTDCKFDIKDHKTHFSVASSIELLKEMSCNRVGIKPIYNVETDFETL